MTDGSVAQLDTTSWTDVHVDLDLLLVALLELAPRDPAISDLLDGALRGAAVPDVARLLGKRLIARAGLDTDQPASA